MARTFELRPHLLPDMPPPAQSAGHKIELSEAQARARVGDAELERLVFVLNLFCRFKFKHKKPHIIIIFAWHGRPHGPDLVARRVAQRQIQHSAARA